MFKFNFENQDTKPKELEEVEEEPVCWIKSTEIKIDQELYSKKFLEKCCACSSLLNCIGTRTPSIRHISSSNVAYLFPNDWSDISSSFSASNEANSDLVAAVYEGGLKVWECTADLLNYLANYTLDFKNKNVIDLGCGAGIIGIYALLQGASVYFQDYNAEVVKMLTIPNVLLNFEDTEKVKTIASFYCGDWKSFLEITENTFTNDEQKFDYIFTSETIYNPNNYRKLIAVFKTCLKKNGAIYLAAKCHYFGVGGGVREFEDVLKQEEIFDFVTCWLCTEGVKREILKITFKP